MNRTASLLAAALVAFGGLAAAIDSPAEAGRKGRNIAVGVAVGIAAAAIIANSNRAYASDRGYRRSGWRSRCNRWLRECDRGNDYSCEKFETRGCTE
ncbi:MAG: hypothetical protein B7Y80_13075 [Hyphomicrobium sp. 32-62-53]|nr:MAG: hypothetical protein B7Y80_13075 [Hyphomicrobium sp. 32-62-53]